MSTIRTHIVAPTTDHTHTIILLHGRGSNAEEFAEEFFESQASDDSYLAEIFPSFKWVFPCAAVRYAETEQEDMHQWFDMASVREPARCPETQLDGLRESVQGILEILKKEAEEIGGYEKIFLAGISQGCATAIVTLLANNEQIAGFVGVSSWMPFTTTASATSRADFESWLQEKLCLTCLGGTLFGSHGLEMALRVPVLLEHAIDDEVVPVENGIKLREGLKGMEVHVEWHRYQDGGHWVNEPKGIDDMVAFIRKYS